MTKFKNLTVILIAVLMLFCLSVITGCSDDNKVKDLQQRITELEEENKNLNDGNRQLTEKNEELTGENKELSDELKQEAQAAKGAFYSLQEAYDNGLLTQDNLKAIADYHNNGKTSSENLTDAEENAIKITAAYQERGKAETPVPEAMSKDYKILNYYGKYNGSYAVILNTPYSGMPGVDVDEWEYINGVGIHYTQVHKIVIWKLS